MAELLSLRGYGRHRGVSLKAVQKAIESGRITTEVNGKIDPVKADAQWLANTDQSKPLNSISGNPKKRKNDSTPNVTPDTPPNDNPIASESANVALSFNKSRASRELFQAKLAQIDVDERMGKLHNVDECRIAVFNQARRARDMLMSIPARLAPRLVGVDDVKEMDRLLTQEIRIVCEQLSKTSNGN